MTQEEAVEFDRLKTARDSLLLTVARLRGELDTIAAKEREAIYQLVMEAPFKEFDRQEEEFDGEAANAMKAMAFSLTAAIRARGEQA